jgi:deoxyhypusine synthase
MQMSSHPRLLSDFETRKKKADLLNQKVKPIDLETDLSIKDLVSKFKDTSIQARGIGDVASVFERMLLDPERPTIILGLAGPLIAAGLRKVICDLIAYGMVDCVVSTGAILYQDYYQAHGCHHYKGTPQADDTRLRELLIDRIYDTYVDEEKFSALDNRIGQIADGLPPGEYSSRSFLEALTQDISDPQSILVTASRKGIPIFSPAINDSSIGIGLTEHYYRTRQAKRRGIIMNSIRDNYELTQIVVKSKQTAAVYVAGGVPKNFINDAIVMAYIFGHDTGGHKYAVQMTADVPQWGGLSGSTLTEAKSWGKMKSEASTATVHVEPSVSFPLVAGYAIQKKLNEGRAAIHYQWNDDALESITYTTQEHVESNKE